MTSAPDSGPFIGTIPMDWVASTNNMAPTDRAASENRLRSYLCPLAYSTCEMTTTAVFSSIRESISSGSV